MSRQNKQDRFSVNQWLWMLGFVVVGVGVFWSTGVDSKTATKQVTSPQEVFAQMIHAIDSKNWSLAQQQMASKVHTDYESLFGAKPSTQSSKALIQTWTQLLGPLDATQHLLGTPVVKVDGQSASLRVSVRGYHATHDLRDGNRWMVAGLYEVGLTKVKGEWKVASIRLNTLYQDGNPKLLSQVQARVRKVASFKGVTCRLVWFTSLGERLAGHLCTPTKHQASLPGVVVLGSWTTIKEQMAGLYARKLAAAGYAALAFDPYGYGESAGSQRDVESPQRKMMDVRAAAAYLSNHPWVKGKSVGALGVCAGAGYIAGAAAKSSHIKAVALVAPWLHDAKMVRLVYGGEKGVQQRLSLAKAARANFQKTGTIEYVPAVSTTNRKAAMFGAFSYYLSAKRGAIKAWSNRFAVMAWKDWLTFDPHPYAKQLGQPTLIVHSKKAALPVGAQRFYGNLKASKKLVWMPGSQFHFYDDAKTLNKVVGHLKNHFARHLKAK